MGPTAPSQRSLGKALRQLEKRGFAEAWVPAFPTDLVRGLKAHGKTVKSYSQAPSPGRRELFVLQLQAWARCTLVAASILLLLATAVRADGPDLGRPVSPQEIAAWDISIGPDGAGLPPGSGTPRQGERVYAAKCVGCHGEKGIGKPNDQLVGGIGSLTGDQPPVKTVGSFWPYATTLFDYVRRAMPLNAPKSLSDDEVYAVAAYILRLNGIIGDSEAMNAQTLPLVKMPNRDGFVPFSPSK
jgi:S-disulfanyl-L-cysteine oxidoreductase SoxD